MKKFLLALVMCAWAVNANARCFDSSKDDGYSRSCTVSEAYGVDNGKNYDRVNFIYYHMGYVDANIDMHNALNGYNDDLFDCFDASPKLIEDIIFEKYKKGDVNGNANFKEQIEITILERVNNCRKRLNIQ